MANDTITALRNALNDLGKEQRQKEASVVRLQEDVVRVQNVLQDLQGRAKCADYERRAIEKDIDALRTLYNNSPDKPRSVSERIERLQADHTPAFTKSQAASEALRSQEEALRATQTRLGVAQEELKEITVKHRELSDLLQREQNNL
jgi:chromosome segregation ATPase